MNLKRTVFGEDFESFLQVLCKIEKLPIQFQSTHQLEVLSKYGKNKIFQKIKKKKLFKPIFC